MHAISRLLLVGTLVVVGGIVAWWFGRSAKWDLAAMRPPWGERPSIYEHVLRHVPDVGVGLRAGGDKLPDEAIVRGEHQISWVAGALDGVMGRHAGGGDEAEHEALVRDVFEALERALRAPTQGNIDKLYKQVGESGVLGVIDPLVERIANASLPEDRLEELARWLATKAADREPVKFGVAMLGLFPGARHHQVFHTLGRHEEFTLFAGVAFSNSDPDNAERHWFELVRHVDGWGRIQIVERFADTNDEAIERWMLRDGYRNSVMYEYLAYICATAGGLRDALTANEIDDELLHGAGDLISALITGNRGPAQGIDDYLDAASVVQRYLDHLEPRIATLDELIVVGTLHRFVSDESDGWDKRSANGWSANVRTSVQTRTAAILAQPRWRTLVEAGFDAHEQEFWKVAEAARALGMDIWDVHYRRTRQRKDHWFQLMETSDETRVAKVVALGEERLPLDAIASGPGTDLGLGPEFEHHGHLDAIVQSLGKHPGLGWSLIRAALRSPVVRNRNMAINALRGWGRNAWPSDTPKALDQAIRDEPDERVKRRIEALVANAPDPED